MLPFMLARGPVYLRVLLFQPPICPASQKIDPSPLTEMWKALRQVVVSVVAAAQNCAVAVTNPSMPK
ncbi:hypothetical protein CEXT_240231 [Caerostris extrusa]|uniref:Secreted protein n=1 Tax=Caerostris extrusa TaxID=172846 RepID=A0AAV4PVA2_CAEEX|nr:hypothetical protein CEXT_240231 [Caerostris extrusa]